MRRSPMVWIAVVFAVLWLSGMAIGVRMLLRHGLGSFFDGPSGQTQVTVPAGKCPTSLAIFNFRWHGSPDARYYAIGFARSLADRTCCAPRHVTQQMSINEIRGAIGREKTDYTAPISDEFAVKLAKKTGVCYAVTGDLTLSGALVEISLCITDLDDHSSRRVYSASGQLADLPKMQSKLAREIIAAMKICASPAAAAGLGEPNFTKPETLKLYGQGFVSKTKDCEQLRWKGLQVDPHSMFAFGRLLDFYCSGPYCCAEVRNNGRLAKTLAHYPAEFADNSQTTITYGLLLAKESNYEQAQSVLSRVAKDDPGMIRAHTALSYVARLRGDSDLALAECRKAAEAWPNNAYVHSELADAYSLIADDARGGRYSADMSREEKDKWRTNSQNSLREAYIAVKLDPDWADAWSCVLSDARELGLPRDTDNAYRELIRIDPKDIDAYTNYAYCFSPQWGGSDADQKRIFKDAERAFPRGAYEPLLVRAASLGCNSDDDRDDADFSREILRLTDEICRKAGERCENAVGMRCDAYEWTGNRAGYLQLAQRGFKQWGGLDWQFKYSMGCSLAYEDKHDPKYLEKARQLCAEYVRQVPFDPKGYIQVGWCLSHQGKRKEAKAMYLKALDIDPGNETALEKLKDVQ